MNFLTYGFTTGLIVAIDQLLIIVNIAVITRIGFSTHEIVVRQICMSIFYSQFFNNGLLLLVSNANLQYSPLSFISLESKYTEMDARWYQDVAPQIITSMFFKSFMPFVQLALVKLQMQIGKYLDRQSCSESDKTKKVTIQQYIEVYAGPDL